MNRRVVLSRNLAIDNAAVLQSVIDNIETYVGSRGMHTVYLMTSDGDMMDKITLEEETLTDGSKVYNLIFHVEKD